LPDNDAMAGVDSSVLEALRARMAERPEILEAYLSRYCDYLPHLAKIDRELARRLADGSFGR